MPHSWRRFYSTRWSQGPRDGRFGSYSATGVRQKNNLPNFNRVRPRSKILKTIASLKKNNIEFSRLFYVTNREIRNQDILSEEVYTKENVILLCRDIAWLRGNVGQTDATLRVYANFIRNTAHVLPINEHNLILKDFITDPRVFVYLRQQIGNSDDERNLRELLVDSLILYGLEGTDPDAGILRSKYEIISEVKK